ncbi:MAG: hypothetical protein HC838_16645 [Spirulinaceae cyanobacterium RM2_2_10]|nr:hypothetical protein [Spirulinaceae cyanobacterium RM2_2_10]
MIGYDPRIATSVLYAQLQAQRRVLEQTAHPQHCSLVTAAAPFISSPGDQADWEPQTDAAPSASEEGETSEPFHWLASGLALASRWPRLHGLRPHRYGCACESVFYSLRC